MSERGTFQTSKYHAEAMSRFSNFEADPEAHIVESDLDLDDYDREESSADDDEAQGHHHCVNPNHRAVRHTVMCRVAPQGSYQAGRLMCSICSTVMGLCVASGVMPDPGTISPVMCMQLISSIMERSASMQKASLLDCNNNEMKQISEVVTIIQAEGMVALLSGDQRIECFGPLSHAHASEQEMSTACSACPSKVTVTSSWANAPTCLIKGLDKLLMQDMGRGDGIVITAMGHTVYMMGSSSSDLIIYIFDPLYGSLDSVDGGWRSAYKYMNYGAMVGNDRAHKKNGGLAGGEGAMMYTAMIMRKPVVAPTPSQKVDPKLVVNLALPPNTKEVKIVKRKFELVSPPVSKTAMKMEIMDEANKVLERMHGGPVVRALRVTMGARPIIVLNI